MDFFEAILFFWKGSASECVLVSLLSARGEILRKLKARHPFVEDGILLSKLVMYTSKLVNTLRHLEICLSEIFKNFT